jgi:hypothetical protein
MLFVLSLLACQGMLGYKSSEEWSDDKYGEETGVVTLDVNDSHSDNLSAGEVIDIAWAENSTVACWPGTENLNFSGAHVFYTMEQPPHSRLTATVIPGSDNLDVNVYIIQQDIGGNQFPPDVHSVISCEAGYPAATDSNPGASDSAFIDAITNSYLVIIGVAGAEGFVSGAYTLQTRLEDY